MAATQKDETQLSIARTMHDVPWCDDYEKMISGMLYNANVPELNARKLKCRRLVHKYNTWFPDDDNLDFDKLASIRYAMLKENLGSVGDDVYIEPPFTVDYGCNLRLGDRFYANFNFMVLDCGIVTIGSRTMLGPNVSIFAATHEVEVQSRRDNVEFAKPVVIGDDCWIGGHVVILPGVTIGDGVTIGAGSVVTKDVPSWSVAMGSPARVVKKVAPLEKLEGRRSSFAAIDRVG